MSCAAAGGKLSSIKFECEWTQYIMPNPADQGFRSWAFQHEMTIKSAALRYDLWPYGAVRE
jgi:hypothetical protein